MSSCRLFTACVLDFLLYFIHPYANFYRRAFCHFFFVYHRTWSRNILFYNQLGWPLPIFSRQSTGDHGGILLTESLCQTATRPLLSQVVYTETDQRLCHVGNIPSPSLSVKVTVFLM